MFFYILSAFLIISGFTIAHSDSPWDPRTGLTSDEKTKEPIEKSEENKDKEIEPECDEIPIEE